MIRRVAVRIFYSLCKILIPKKYYDSIFIGEFVNHKNLKRFRIKKMIWCFIHGFLPYEYFWYDLGKNDYRNYVPARNNFKNRSLNGIYNSILANKLLFEKHLKSVIADIDNLHVIDSIGLIENGHLHPLHKEIISGDYSSLLPFLEKNDLIIKPAMGDGGVGLLEIRKENDDFCLNNKKVDWNKLILKFNSLDHHLIQEKFRQKGLSNEINPGAVNTVRIVTMIDPINHKPFIAYAVHRFGSSHSGFMDNVSQGGISALISLSEGKLSKGIYFSNEGEREIFDLHPVSSNPIYNRQIPNWSSFTKSLIELAARMPYLKYVGWDIIISEDKLYVLEGNVSPGLGLVQMFKPMTDFPEAWSFFKYYKYIK